MSGWLRLWGAAGDGDPGEETRTWSGETLADMVMLLEGGWWLVWWCGGRGCGMVTAESALRVRRPGCMKQRMYGYGGG